jgi:tyrosinase
MTSLSRRTFVRGMAAMPFAVWLARNAYASTPYIRYDIGSPEGQAMIAVFADAVSRMKRRGEQDPLSWLWQWYTHFVSGTTTKSAEIGRIFGTTVSPQSSLASEMWNTCQSHAGQNANHFLPWHRMFVFFLEQIVREVTGRLDFTLPYWNYTSYDPAKRGIVPQQFRLPGDPVFGSLYRVERTSLANSGQPIHKYQSGDAMNISTAMAKQYYSSIDSVQGFCRAIDSGIHGKIHVLVGTSKNMGAVPYAAQDPLFWVHHANIDRLWTSWNRNGGLNPGSGTWLNKVFVFADRTGQRVTGKLKDFFNTDVLGYSYDRYVAVDGSESTSAQALSRMAVEKIGPVAERIAVAASAELGERPVRAILKPEAGKSATALDPTHRRRAYLVVKNLHTWSQPEVLFHLYLSPRAWGPNPNTYVGSINFFDAEFHDHGDGSLGDALGENFYSFDVTSLLQRLAGRSGSGPDMPMDVTFVPGGRPTPGARPLVGSIQLVWQ